MLSPQCFVSDILSGTSPFSLFLILQRKHDKVFIWLVLHYGLQSSIRRLGSLLSPAGSQWQKFMWELFESQINFFPRAFINKHQIALHGWQRSLWYLIGCGPDMVHAACFKCLQIKISSSCQTRLTRGGRWIDTVCGLCGLFWICCDTVCVALFQHSSFESFC